MSGSAKSTSSDLPALIDSARAAERAGDLEGALSAYEMAFRRLITTRDEVPSTAADLLRWMGTIHRERGDLDLAGDLYETSLAIAENSALPIAIVQALNCLAIVEQYRGQLDDAVGLYQRARDGAADLGDRHQAAMIEQNLGIVANIRGDVSAALRHYQSALAVYREIDDSNLVLRCLNNVGMAHVDQKDWDAARAVFDEAFALAEQTRDTTMLGNIALNRAELYLKCREYESARECCDVGFEISTRLDLRSSQAEAHKFYGILYRETSKPALATVHFSLAVTIAHECEDRLLEAESEHEHGLLLLDGGYNQPALQRLNRAHHLFAELQARREISDVDGRLNELETTFMKVMQRWGESIESTDSYTAGHCQRVADYACMLATAVGIEGRELTWFRMGAFLHDVGKIEVPHSILNKPGKLEPDEWKLMQRHTVAGNGIIAKLDFPWNIRPIVRSHHEQWCGKGYPDGLAGNEIPRHARILCIANVYDALTTSRSYRPALPQEEAIRIMDRDAGQIFDPDLYLTFRNLIVEPRTARAPTPELRRGLRLAVGITEAVSPTLSSRP